MKLYTLINKDDEFLARKKTSNYSKKNDSLFTTKTEFDRVITYRSLKHIQNFYNDTHYFQYRNIKIKDFEIVEIELQMIIKK